MGSFDCYTRGCAPRFDHGFIGDVVDVYITRVRPDGIATSIIARVMVDARSCLTEIHMLLGALVGWDAASAGESFTIEARAHNDRDVCMSLDKRAEPPTAVREAIERFYEESATEVFRSLRYFPGDDFWGFTRHGMFVGVERDGYMHT